MNKLNGINLGIIKSPQGVLAIALKISTQQRQQLIYLPPEQLKSVFFACFWGYRHLQKLHDKMPESIREQVIASTQALNSHTLSFSDEELSSPKIDLRVTDFVMKQQQDSINYIFFLQDDNIITLELMFTQMEYVLSAMLTTIQTAEDEALMQLCLNSNDFLPLFTVDFDNGENKGINYNQFSPPKWQLDAFDTYHSVVYIQPDGKISCGFIFKAASFIELARIENIAQFLLYNNGLLTRYKDHKMTINHAYLDISPDEGTMDSLFRAHLAHRTKAMN